MSTPKASRRSVAAERREREDRWKFAIEPSGDGLWDWHVSSGGVFVSTRWKAKLLEEPNGLKLIS